MMWCIIEVIHPINSVSNIGSIDEGCRDVKAFRVKGHYVILYSHAEAALLSHHNRGGGRRRPKKCFNFYFCYRLWKSISAPVQRIFGRSLVFGRCCRTYWSSTMLTPMRRIFAGTIILTFRRHFVDNFQTLWSLLQILDFCKFFYFGCFLPLASLLPLLVSISATAENKSWNKEASKLSKLIQAKNPPKFSLFYILLGRRIGLSLRKKEKFYLLLL